MHKCKNRIWTPSWTIAKEIAEMLRNIHFFNIKPGADEKRVLHLVDYELAEYAKTFGCIERKTWKFLNASVKGQPAESAAYLNESLWPSQKEADAISQAERPEEIQKWWEELLLGIDIVKTVRYVDDEG
jgi:hypothetical protein